MAYIDTLEVVILWSSHSPVTHPQLTCPWARHLTLTAPQALRQWLLTAPGLCRFTATHCVLCVCDVCSLCVCVCVCLISQNSTYSYNLHYTPSAICVNLWCLAFIDENTGLCVHTLFTLRGKFDRVGLYLMCDVRCVPHIVINTLTHSHTKIHTQQLRLGVNFLSPW